MDFKNITNLIDRIEKSNITKFEFEEKDFKLKLEKNASNTSNTSTTVVETINTVVEEPVAEKAPEKVSGNKVLAPIVGTFYSSVSPEAEPFVKIGDKVSKGDTIGIIEAMKLFNEVQSEYSGTVKEILVNTSDMVEFNQPIMIIE